MARQTLIVGNWKMHKTIAEARAFVTAMLARRDCFVPQVQVAVAPPFTALAGVAAELGDQSRIALCAQTMHWAPSGPYTGAISAPMLTELGCMYVLLGHSERRSYNAETDEIVNREVKAALLHELVPIVAVGETLFEHNAGRAKERVVEQTRAAFEGVADDQIARSVLAYEPIWAIGSGLAEDPANANEVMGAMRDCLPALANVQILYGGSVKPANVSALVTQEHIDGALVGGASLEVESFVELVINARAAVGAR
ncbi:MAG: triose-phosphate isomerase [Candidatus Eremiobacteraeota bacterium]|nr:triose-phosphate isomerase [Candidatus Eremiobacteraeota bacterium]